MATPIRPTTTITLKRADLWPTGTEVGLYEHDALRSDGGVSGLPIATATVDAAGAVSFTVTEHVGHVASAVVAGTRRSLRFRAGAFEPPPTWAQKVEQRAAKLSAEWAALPPRVTRDGRPV
jgi:hypothetical protein